MEPLVCTTLQAAEEKDSSLNVIKRTAHAGFDDKTEYCFRELRTVTDTTRVSACKTRTRFFSRSIRVSRFRTRVAKRQKSLPARRS